MGSPVPFGAGRGFPYFISGGSNLTILQAISWIDAIKVNAYKKSSKVYWLSQLDGRIKKEIIDTHDGAENTEFAGYGDDTPTDTVLLVPAPYDEMYQKWLESCIDYANGEYGKYNNSITVFNNAYAAYERYYNRTHMPHGKKFVFF